jgi:hypothetical protein
VNDLRSEELSLKKLYFVPIIHSRSDMGSVASALSEKGALVLGNELWRQHEETVAGFWNSISKFFESMEVHGHHVYQDGLLADGEGGLRIVKEGAERGSANFKILAGLVQRGAVLIKTEDISLVKQEHSYIVALAGAKSPAEQNTAALNYKRVERHLLEERDRFIARTIDTTMKEGDSGELFIGAYHDVLARLPGDIHVVRVKEIGKLREYHTLLTRMDAPNWARRLNELSHYLISPVSSS